MHGLFPEEKITERARRMNPQGFYLLPSLSIIQRLQRTIGVYVKNMGGVWFGVACDEQRIFGISFAASQQGAVRSLLEGMPFGVPFQTFSKPSAFAESILAMVKNVYDGKDVSQVFPLSTEHLSAYTKRVLEATSFIPVGYVASYGSVAKAAGGSARAVGNVMAANPFAPIVPCHRVVCSDFTLGGYGGGLDVKYAFLVREKRGYKSQREIPVGSKKLMVFPVEFVLKNSRNINDTCSCAGHHIRVL